MTENAGAPAADVTENGAAVAPTVEDGAELGAAERVSTAESPGVQGLTADRAEPVDGAVSAEDDGAGSDGAGSGGAGSGGAGSDGAGSGGAGSGGAGSDGADSGSVGSDGAVGSRMSRHDLLVAEGDAAGDYLERLLDILDFDGDIDLDVEGERAVVSIIGGGDVAKLVGDHGEVLDALQELSRLAATAETGQRSRLMLDIAGFRERRRAELTELGRQTAEQVLKSGEPVRLSAMNPFERKVVHDAVGTVDGVSSSSDGEEPHRRIVVSPAG